MKTVVLDPNPEVEAMIVRRHDLGIDRFDEVWEGVYHMVPGPSGPHAMLDRALGILLGPYADAAGLVGVTGFNLGTGPDNYRVPDGGYLREVPTGVWIPTAAVVVEILSPDDETFAKFGFYATRGVEEILVVDAAARQILCFGRPGDGWLRVPKSELLGVTTADLTDRITWP